jgi:hypothetical protein
MVIRYHIVSRGDRIKALLAGDPVNMHEDDRLGLAHCLSSMGARFFFSILNSHQNMER